MAFLILLTALSHLVINFHQFDSVAIILNALSIFSFRVLWRRVAWIGFSQNFFWPLPWPLLSLFVMFCLVLLQMICCVYLGFLLTCLCLQVLLVWAQRNDHRFRSKPLSALCLLARLKQRLCFYLPLFFKPFISNRRCHYFL